MEQRRRCFNMLGQEVDCVLTENWLNAAGVYIQEGENGSPAGAYVDLGNSGLTGIFGQLPPAPDITDRMQFIDDPAWKHWLKIALFVLLALLALKTVISAVKL